MKKISGILILFLIMTVPFSSAASGNCDSNELSRFHYNGSSSPATDYCGSFDADLFNGASVGSSTATSFNDAEELDLTSSQSYGVIQNSATDFNTNSFTWATWVKTSESTYKPIISKRDAGDSWAGPAISLDPNGSAMLNVNDGSDHRMYGSSINDGNFHFVVGKYDALSNNYSIYVDGSLDSSQSLNLGDFSTNRKISLGTQRNDDGSIRGNQLVGYLDETSLYSRALTHDEIVNLYDFNSIEGSTASPPSLSNFVPSDGSTQVNTSVNLSVDVSDNDDSSANVSFYWGNDTVISQQDNVALGTVEAEVTNLDYNTEFEWYVEATDDEGTTTSSKKSFRTMFSSNVKSGLDTFEDGNASDFPGFWEVKKSGGASYNVSCQTGLSGSCSLMMQTDGSFDSDDLILQTSLNPNNLEIGDKIETLSKVGSSDVISPRMYLSSDVGVFAGIVYVNDEWILKSDSLPNTVISSKSLNTTKVYRLVFEYQGSNSWDVRVFNNTDSSLMGELNGVSPSSSSQYSRLEIGTRDDVGSQIDVFYDDTSYTFETSSFTVSALNPAQSKQISFSSGTGNSLDFNGSASTASSSLKNVTFYGNFSGSFTSIKSQTLSGNDSDFSFDYSIGEGSYKYGFNVYKDDGSSKFSSNKTFSVTQNNPPSVSSVSPSDGETGVNWTVAPEDQWYRSPNTRGVKGQMWPVGADICGDTFTDSSEAGDPGYFNKQPARDGNYYGLVGSPERSLVYSSDKENWNFNCSVGGGDGEFSVNDYAQDGYYKDGEYIIIGKGSDDGASYKKNSEPWGWESISPTDFITSSGQETSISETGVVFDDDREEWITGYEFNNVCGSACSGYANGSTLDNINKYYNSGFVWSYQESGVQDTGDPDPYVIPYSGKKVLFTDVRPDSAGKDEYKIRQYTGDTWGDGFKIADYSPVFTSEPQQTEWDSEGVGDFDVYQIDEDFLGGWYETSNNPGNWNEAPIGVARGPLNWSVIEFDVSDDTASNLDVLLVDAADDRIMLNRTVQNGSRVSLPFAGNGFDETRNWYVNVSDGDTVYHSQTYSYQTESSQDSSAPIISVDSITEGETLNTDTVVLDVTSDEDVNWTYEVDGGSNTSVNSNDQDLNETLTGLSDGQHTVNVYGTDSAGNTGSDSVTFTVNTNDAPFASLNTSVSDSTVSVDASGSFDDNGITSYEYDWTNDGTYDATGETNSHTYSSDGTYTVKLRVTDGQGATDTATSTVTIDTSSDGGGGGGGGGGTTDTTPPTSTDDYELSGFLDKSQVNVQLSASDSGSGVDRIEYQVNGNGYTSVSGNSVDLNLFNEGNNTLRYYAVDNNGNQESVNTEYVAFQTSSDGGGDGSDGDGSDGGSTITPSLTLKSPSGNVTTDGSENISQDIKYDYHANDSASIKIQVSTPGQSTFTDAGTVSVTEGTGSKTFTVDLNNLDYIEKDGFEITDRFDARIIYTGSNGYQFSSAVNSFKFKNQLENNATGSFFSSGNLTLYIILFFILAILALPIVAKVRINDD